MRLKKFLMSLFRLNRLNPGVAGTTLPIVKEHRPLLLTYDRIPELILESENAPASKPIQTELNFGKHTVSKPHRRRERMRQRNLSPILQVAKEVMQDNSAVMHVSQITEIAIKTNKNLGYSAEEFMNKLSSALASHVKTQNSIFSKPLNKDGTKRKGYYRLKRTAKAPITPIPVPKTEKISTNYSGKAGEFAVASELLFLGCNVSMMAVDEGIDLITEKDGKFKYVQVKTTVVEDGNNSFAFKVPEKQFQTNLAYEPFYVFVMRECNHLNYAVIPSAHLDLLRAQQKISGKDFSIVISRDIKRKEYKLNGENINHFIGAFNLLYR